MLQLLPNEILVNILIKTENKTIRNCRLLNNRFNQIIERFEPNKQDFKEFRIGNSCIRYNDIKCDMEIVDKNSNTKKRTFESFEEMTKLLPCIAKRIGKVNTLVLSNIEISLALVDVLLRTEGLRKIANLNILRCQFDASVTNKWMAYLESLNTEAFISHGSNIPVSKTFFNKVGFCFAYISSYILPTPDFAWLDDELLENWYSHGKSLQIWNCTTSLTIDGIMRMLPKFSTGFKDLGTLKNVQPNEIANALNVAGADGHTSDRLDRNITYMVYPNNETSLPVTFSCPKPNPPLHIEQ